MKKTFVDPFCEVVLFGKADVVRTSDCCNTAGIVFEDDDEVCPSQDGECTTYCVDP